MVFNINITGLTGQIENNILNARKSDSTGRKEN